MKKFIKLLTAFVIAGSMCLNVSATSITDLQEQKEQAEDKKAEAQAILDQLQNEQNNILDAIRALDDQVAEYNAQIVDLEAQKEQLQTDIEVKEAELAVAKEAEQEQYDAMKLHIQYSYENGNVEYLDTVFSTSDISDIVNKSEYVEQIYEYDSEMLNKLIEIKKTIANTQLQLKTDLASVEAIEAEVTENKEAVEIMIEGKQTQVANYNSSIGEYEAQLAQIQADIDAVDAAIAEAEREQAARNEAAAAAGQDVPVYYTGGTLQWPVSTGGVITSYFGPRWGRMHNGLDIGCPTGTPIVACESGVVIAAGYSGSMGNYVLIDHGNNTTTVYMHNSSLAVSVGQTVSRAQVIAYAGSTGNSTGPHCHLGLRINGTYVDPLPYLQQ